MAEDADNAQQALHLCLEAARETGGAGAGWGGKKQDMALVSPVV